MLLELTIKNIALIESLRIEFAQGFNVLTGETGAGKSIVVDSVNLALGGRADREIIRTGAEKGEVQALFDITGNERAEAMARELGIDVEENSYYDTLAYALCSFSYDSDDIMNYGMTAKELYEECYGFNPHSSIAKLDVHKVDALLKELVILNILRTETDGEETRYLFSRASFIEMLGTKTQVEDHLLEALGGE